MNGCTVRPAPMSAIPWSSRSSQLRPNAEEQKRRERHAAGAAGAAGQPRSEIRHHMTAFGVTLNRLYHEGIAFEAVLPTMPHLEEAVAEGLKYWTVSRALSSARTRSALPFALPMQHSPSPAR